MSSQHDKLFSFHIKHKEALQWLSSRNSFITCVFVLGLVHLAVGAFPYDANYIKFVDTAFAPVALGVFALAISRAANPVIHQETNKTNRWKLTQVQEKESWK